MEPCVLVASACESLPTNVIVKGILGREELPEPLNFIDGVRSYPWHISTKYYEADIHVCTLDKKTIGSQAFADTVNAVVICFDSKADPKLEAVEQWLPFTKEFEAHVKILVCDQCSEDSVSNSAASQNGISKFEAQSWCVRNGFELVELNPLQDDEDSDVDDDFPESVGMPRVIQALQAHLWPNLTLKGAAGRQILPPHAGLQHIANGFSPPTQDNISSSSREATTDNDKDPNSKKEIKVATVKPMPKLVPSQEETNRSTEGSFNSSNLVTNNKEEESSSVARETKAVDSSSKPMTSSSGAYSQPSAPISSSLSSSSSSHSNNTREVGIVPPLVEISDDSSKAQEAGEPETSSSTSSAAESQQRPSSHPPRDDRIDSMLEALDSMSEDSFEQLFANLSVMKSKAANLSPTERKVYAEKMAIAFWRSIGGDESEIANLSSGDEED